MSVFAPLKNATVTVARLSSTDVNGDPTYGTQSTISVRLTEKVEREYGIGTGVSLNAVTRIATDEWEFAKTDAIWLPGTDTGSPDNAVNPERVGSANTAGVYLYTATL